MRPLTVRLVIGPFERTLALRYFRRAQGRNRSRSFLRFVTFAAIGGVATGVAALLLALMIVRGFEAEIESKIVGFGQHVQIESYLGSPLAAADSLARIVEQQDGVEAVTPVVLDFALLRARPADGPSPEAAIEGVLLWGTPPDGQPFVAASVPDGAFDFAPDAEGRPGLVLGLRLAEALGAATGDPITVFATRTASGTGGRPRVRPFHVAGIYDTGLADFDERFVYADLDEARDLLGFAPDQVSRLDVRLDAIERSPDAADGLAATLGPPAYARSVYDVYRGLFAWVELQASIVPLLISMLVVVAAFNIIGTLFMVVLEKTREIGTVLAMGASQGAVRRLFLVLGALIGTTGALLGGALALAFGLVQDRYRVIPLPQEAYYLDAAPVELVATDFVWVMALAIVLCTVAAYLPARAAAGVEPIRTIRFGS